MVMESTSDCALLSVNVSMYVASGICGPTKNVIIIAFAQLSYDISHTKGHMMGRFQGPIIIRVYSKQLSSLKL